VIPTLVLVEVWHWTPLVMLIVLGGLAALPTEPYEAALIDGATPLADVPAHHPAAARPSSWWSRVIRTIDALKAFDTIFVITQGGPGTASETINIFLYLQAFAFYNIGYASAVVVVFFVIIILLALVLLWTRQRAKWNA
jgi:multiple sugar transport system permease protein